LNLKVGQQEFVKNVLKEMNVKIMRMAMIKVEAIVIIGLLMPIQQQLLQGLSMGNMEFKEKLWL